jgi:hypothetical protein
MVTRDAVLERSVCHSSSGLIFVPQHEEWVCQAQLAAQTEGCVSAMNVRLNAALRSDAFGRVKERLGHWSTDRKLCGSCSALALSTPCIRETHGVVGHISGTRFAHRLESRRNESNQNRQIRQESKYRRKDPRSVRLSMSNDSRNPRT